MRLSQQALQKYTVQTVSGEVLGKVSDMIYDCESYSIVQFVVTGGMLKSHVYRIHPHQVVSITNAQMIVQDTVERILQDDDSSSLATGANPVMMREIE